MADTDIAAGGAGSQAIASGPRPPAHFAPANGFPLAVYEPFLAALGGDFALSASEHAATDPEAGPPPADLTWNDYAAAMIAELEAADRGPVTGIGHSMGATCMVLAASRRPDLFSRLVLFEPAMVPTAIWLMFRLLPRRLMARVRLIRNTLEKPDRWPDHAAFRDYCRTQRVYRRFSDEAIELLVRHGLRDSPEGGVTLAFPKAWEAHNYLQVHALWGPLGRLGIPVVALRGAPSFVFPDRLWQDWRRRAPGSVFLEDPRYGHLMPLEDPQAAAALIRRGLGEEAGTD